MAKNTIINYPNVGSTKAKVGTAATQVIFTAGVNGSKILALYISGAVTTAYTISLKLNDGTDQVLINTVAYTTDANGQFDLLAALGFPKTSAGTRYFNIETGTTISSTTSNAVMTVVYAENY